MPGLLLCEDGLRFLLAPGVLIEGVVLTPEGTPAVEANVSCIEGIQQRPDGGASVVYVWHEEYESRVASVAEAETILVTRGKPSDQVQKPKEEFDRIVKELRAKGELYEPNRKE